METENQSGNKKLVSYYEIPTYSLFKKKKLSTKTFMDINDIPNRIKLETLYLKISEKYFIDFKTHIQCKLVTISQTDPIFEIVFRNEQ